ncbi:MULTISPECIES: AzlC family ABC transporter permease [unclassified Photobacterium]|uniref:AzlC family ABC transporter permease n=1 Tax=unclassified Photobacterium TaxID=2628852 RepID=UPI001B8BC8C5|nr:MULTISPECIES: AzlC family ABC transporter permease [unclassified Photobacterium]MDO6705082.1 AzlC family ABC transporter permease [Photobacterium sp. 1_MG-2023]QUJ66598.1 AzlC family ABC transporter permease [Photobacterium sp. GJ3]
MNPELTLTRKERSAFRDASPIVAGYFTVSFVFGLMCINSGLPLWVPAVMSLVVYAGAAQFAFLALVTGGASVLTIVSTTFLINLRHMLMSLYLSEKFEKRRFSPSFKWLYGYGLTDESFAYHSTSIDKPETTPEYFVMFNTSCHLFWVLGALLGSLTAYYFESFITIDLSYALTAMMIFVLSSLANRLDKVIVMLASVAVMILLMMLMDSKLSIFIATFAGCGVGLCLKKR